MNKVRPKQKLTHVSNSFVSEQKNAAIKCTACHCCKINRFVRQNGLICRLYLKNTKCPPKMSSTLMLLWQFWQYKHVNSIAWDVYSFIDEDATLLCIPLYPFVDQSCRTAFKFIWFAHTLNYILCGIVKWFFVCMFVLRCIVTFCIVYCMSWIGMVWMGCGAV